MADVNATSPATPDELCDCSCHEPDGPRHLVPCCHTCPHCGMPIARPKFLIHEARCYFRAEQDRAAGPTPTARDRVVIHGRARAAGVPGEPVWSGESEDSP